MHRESRRSTRMAVAPIRTTDPTQSSSSNGIPEFSVTTTFRRKRSSLLTTWASAHRVDTVDSLIIETGIASKAPRSSRIVLRPRTQLCGQPRIGHLIQAPVRCPDENPRPVRPTRIFQQRNIVRHLRGLADRVPREPAVLGMRRTNAHRRAPTRPTQETSALTRASPAIDFTG